MMMMMMTAMMIEMMSIEIMMIMAKTTMMQSLITIFDHDFCFSYFAQNFGLMTVGCVVEACDGQSGEIKDKVEKCGSLS